MLCEHSLSGCLAFPFPFFLVFPVRILSIAWPRGPPSLSLPLVTGKIVVAEDPETSSSLSPGVPVPSLSSEECTVALLVIRRPIVLEQTWTQERGTQEE